MDLVILTLYVVFVQVNRTLNLHANYVLRCRLQRLNRRLELLQVRFQPLEPYSAQWDTVWELSSYGPLSTTVPGKVSLQRTASSRTSLTGNRHGFPAEREGLTAGKAGRGREGMACIPGMA